MDRYLCFVRYHGDTRRVDIRTVQNETVATASSGPAMSIVQILTQLGFEYVPDSVRTPVHVGTLTFTVVRLGTSGPQRADLAELEALD